MTTAFPSNTKHSDHRRLSRSGAVSRSDFWPPAAAGGATPPPLGPAEPAHGATRGISLLTVPGLGVVLKGSKKANHLHHDHERIKLVLYFIEPLAVCCYLLRACGVSVELRLILHRAPAQSSFYFTLPRVPVPMRSLTCKSTTDSRVQNEAFELGYSWMPQFRRVTLVSADLREIWATRIQGAPVD